MTSCPNDDVIDDNLFPRKLLKIGLKIKRQKFFEQAMKISVKMPFMAHLAVLIDLLT